MALPSPHSPFAAPSAPSYSRTLAGRSSDIFRPPKPSATPSTSPQHAIATDYFSTQGSRKRYRGETATTPQHTSSTSHNATATPAWVQQTMPTPSDGGMYSSTVFSPFGNASSHGYGADAAVVNERYTLADGFDTPSLQAHARYDLEQPTSEFELERRRAGGGRGGEQAREGVHGAYAGGGEGAGARLGTGEGALWEGGGGGFRVEDMAIPFAGPLARERNGVARVPPSLHFGSYAGATEPGGNMQMGMGGWTSFAFNLAGKLINFGSSVFKGFYAGGGKGYDFKCSTPATPAWPTSSWASDGPSTPLPGSWQTEGYFDDIPQAEERPTAKRRQTDKESWVLVGTPDLEPLDTGSGSECYKRKASSTAVPTRASHAPQNRQRPSPASRAGSRRSMLPTPQHRRQSYTTVAPRPASPTTQVLHPTCTTPRRASFANPRSPTRPSRPSSGHSHGRPASSSNTPRTSPTQQQQQNPYLSPEASRFARRQAKRDRAAETTMQNMSRNIQDLIKQAQEALGTKVEVENEGHAEVGAHGVEDVLDEGFVDEEW